MERNPVLSVRIPAQLKQRLEELRRRTGRSWADILALALEAAEGERGAKAGLGEARSVGALEEAPAAPAPPQQGARVDAQVLAADPAKVNVQAEVPAWLIAMWDIGYRARGYDGSFATWVVEMLALHFVRCRGISLGLIARSQGA